MALYGGLAHGRACFDSAGARDALPASMFSKLAALVQKNWRRLIAATTSSRAR
jgi:hypothetical protein